MSKIEAFQALKAAYIKGDVGRGGFWKWTKALIACPEARAA